MADLRDQVSAAVSPPAAASAAKPGRRRAAHLLLLAVFTCLVFSNTLKNSYHLDDYFHIVANPEHEHFWPPWRHLFDERTITVNPTITQYRPLLPLVFSIDFAIADALDVERVVVHHLGAIATHLGTSVLLYFLFLELLALTLEGAGRRDDLAFAAALAFAVHPVSGVPVNYAVARDLLMMLFFLSASLLAYVRLRQRESVWAWVVPPVLLGMSLLAKQNSVVAPVLILLLDLLVLRASPRSCRTWLRPLPFVAVVAALFVWTELVLGFSDLGQLKCDFSSTTYGCTMAREHLFYYLRNFLWPFRMRPLAYVEPTWLFFEWPVLLGGSVIAASLVAAFYLLRRAPLASFAILGYWVLFAPTSSLWPFRYLVMDYRQYPSLPFLCLLVALGLSRLPRRRLAVVAYSTLVVYFAGSAFVMNRVWKTEKTLWEHTYRCGGEVLANVLYAKSIEDDDPKLSIKLYRMAPVYHVYARDNLAMLYWQQGRLEEAIAQFEENVERASTWALTHFQLASVYRHVGRMEEALDEGAQAAGLDPRNVEYLYRVAFDLLEDGEAVAALPYLERIDSFVPSYADTDLLAGRALESLGRATAAERRYRRFLTRHVDHAEAWLLLARNLADQGRPEEARASLEELLARAPEHEEGKRLLRALGSPLAP